MTCLPCSSTPNPVHMQTAGIVSGALSGVAGVIAALAVSTLLFPVFGALLLGTLFTATLAVVATCLSGIVCLIAASLATWLLCSLPAPTETQTPTPTGNYHGLYGFIENDAALLAALDYFRKSFASLTSKEAQLTADIHAKITVEKEEKGTLITYEFTNTEKDAKNKSIKVVCHAAQDKGFVIVEVKADHNHAIFREVIQMVILGARKQSENWHQVLQGNLSHTDLIKKSPNVGDKTSLMRELPSLHFN